MTAKKRDEIKDLAASIRARLFNLAKERDVAFNFILKLYLLERFLYRLGQSSWRKHFALKGALVFFARADEADRPYERPTKDIDLEALALKNDLGEIKDVFRSVASIQADDAVMFDADSVEVERIREDDRYAGVRVHIDASLGNAKDRIQIDVGFGDAVTPGPIDITYPTLLDTVPKPDLQAYPIETVIAEKWEATISLGEVNSRFKDILDLEDLARTEEFDGAALIKALRRTFERRGTAFEMTAAALTEAYRTDRQRQVDYAAARTRLTRTSAPEQFADAMALVLKFMEPLHRAGAEERAFTGRWHPGNGWS